MNRDRFIREASRIVSECDRQMEWLAARSQTDYRMNMVAGQTMPSFGRYDVPRGSFESEKRALLGRTVSQVTEALRREYQDDMEHLSAPASADDVATVQLMLSSSTLTQSELDSLYDRYKGNNVLSKAISEKAASLNMPVRTSTPSADYEEAKRRVDHLMYRFDGGFVISPEGIAESIADGYQHRDFLTGGYYA